VSGGHNLVGINSGSNGTGCGGFSDGVKGDQVGTDTEPLDPQLGPLAANGGLTQTMALLAGSPAIEAGDPSDCQAAPINGLDQRGKPRNVAARDVCDAGAYDTGG
jgi:hypothetical protein